MDTMGVVIFTFLLVLVWDVSDAPPIRVCHPGTYQDGSSCRSCQPGTFMSLTNHTEKNCFDCTNIEDQTLEILIKPCDQLSDADIQCVEGYYRHLARDSYEIPYCRPCTACPEHYSQVSPCKTFTDTGCCKGENNDFFIVNNMHVCRERRWVCRMGQFFDTTSDDCKPCPNYTFMSEDYHSYTECWDCQYKSDLDLPLHTVISQPCTSTQPPRYKCKDGFYMNRRMGEEGDDIGCSPCQTCDEGMFVGRLCNRYNDTMCCEKPSMTVEDGPQGSSCVDSNRDRKDVGGDAGDSTGVLWVIPLLVLILLIVGVGFCVFYYKKRPESRPKWLQRLVDRFLQWKRRERDHDEKLKQALIDTTLQSKNQELEADKTKLTEEIKEKNNKLESVGSENATLQSKNQELEADKTKLTEEIKEKDNKLESVGSVNETLQTKIRELEAEITKLTNLNEINKRNREMETVGGEKEKLIMEGQNLKEKPDENANHSGEQNQTGTKPSYKIRPQASRQQNETSYCEQESLDTRHLRSSLHTLKDGESHDQALTAERLGKMARDERMRQTILQFPGLVTALEHLKENKHENVTRKVKHALQVITGTTPATDKEKSIPAMVDSTDISVQGTTPTTSEKNCLPAPLDIELNSSVDISVHGHGSGSL